MADRIVTKSFPCVGGLITNMDNVQQGTERPGSAILLTNFEPHHEGGYRRILGYQKFDESLVTGSGTILGVANFKDSVIACRGTDIYVSSGSGWTKVNGTDVHTGAGIYRHQQYSFTGTDKIILVDGVNYPCSLTATNTYLSHTNCPIGSQHVAEFKNRLVFSKDNLLTVTSPLLDNDTLPANGAYVVNIADTITGLQSFREQLFIFCRTRIYRLSGSTSADFQLDPVSVTLGCIHPDTIHEVGGDLFYLGPDGIRTIAGTERNNDFNLALISRQIQTPLRDLVSNFPRILSIPIRSKAQYRIYGYADGVPNTSTQGYVGGIRETPEGGSWEFGAMLGIKANVMDSFYTASGTERVVFGNDTGYIYVLESGNSFDGDAIGYQYQTPYLPFDDISVRKIFRRIKVFLGSDSSYDITIQLVLDYLQPDILQPDVDFLTQTTGVAAFYDSPSAIYDVSTYGSTVTPFGQLSLVGSGFTGSLILTGTDTLSPFNIKSMALDISTGDRK